MEVNTLTPELIRKEAYSFDVDKLKTEAFEVLKDYNYLDGYEIRQFMLTCREGSEDPNFDGVGRLEVPQGKTALEVQKEFNCFNPNYKGTELEKVWKSFPFEVGRVRLMMLGPHRCYSAHTDGQNRYHIALKSNSQSFFFFKGDPHWYQIPVDSHVYSFNAKVEHTAMNGGESGRLHLVFDAVE